MFTVKEITIIVVSGGETEKELVRLSIQSNFLNIMPKL